MQDVESRVGGQSFFEVRLQASDVLDRVDVESSGTFFYAGQSAEPNDLLGLPDWDPEGEYVPCDVICDSTPGEVCTGEIECVSALSKWSLTVDFVSNLHSMRAR